MTIRHHSAEHVLQEHKLRPREVIHVYLFESNVATYYGDSLTMDVQFTTPHECIDLRAGLSTHDYQRRHL